LEEVKRNDRALAVLKLRNDEVTNHLFNRTWVGKTSIGRSVAEARSRICCISLGGLRDGQKFVVIENIGALPGRIIQSLKKAGHLILYLYWA
jgi:ATP-dependent Lon protease